MANPLDPVMEWYRIALDGLRVAQRAIYLQAPGVIQDKHLFHQLDPQAAINRLEAAKSDLARLTVLDLAAVFERVLRQFILGEVNRGYPAPGLLHDAIRGEFEYDIRFWGFAERLIGVFPGVDPQLRGDVKKVIRYRDWVAHAGRLNPMPSEKQPDNVVPEVAEQRLTEFLKAVGIVA